MAAQYLDCSNETIDGGQATGAGGTVTNDVRVIYDDATPVDRVYAAIARAGELFANTVDTPVT